MPGRVKFDRTIFFTVLGGGAVGVALGLLLLRAIVPQAHDPRPAVLSMLVVPLGLFIGWLLSPSREGVATASLVCFGLYFLSTFVAARLRTFFPAWEYGPTVLAVESLAGLGIALALGAAGRAHPRVERLRDRHDPAALQALLHRSDASPAERQEAVRALALQEGPAAHWFQAALADPAGEVRREAAVALTGRATPEDLPYLEAALRDPDLRVRREVLEALRWVEGKEARALLSRYWQQALADGDTRRRLWGQAAPLFFGWGLVLISLFLPWSRIPSLPLPRFSGGAVLVLLLVVGGGLPCGEWLWGLLRGDLSGHLERLRLWALLPLAVVLLIALLPLGGAGPEASGGTAGAGLWVALAGALFGFAGAFFLRG